MLFISGSLLHHFYVLVVGESPPNAITWYATLFAPEHDPHVLADFGDIILEYRYILPGTIAVYLFNHELLWLDLTIPKGRRSFLCLPLHSHLLSDVTILIDLSAVRYK